MTRPAVQQMVLVVDDDESIRVALTYLFRSMELDVRVFSSAAEVLDVGLPDVPCCMVLDIRLPGVSGLDFQDMLAKAGMNVPIVFMTGHGDIPMSVRAMKGGAIDFLNKPFRDQVARCRRARTPIFGQETLMSALSDSHRTVPIGYKSGRLTRWL